jgi:hypothetical protein
VKIRHAVASEAAALREIRLASLAADPHAFGSTYERDLAHPASWWERWAEQSGSGREARTFVVVGNRAARRAYESAGFAFSHAITWTGDGRTLEELILKRTL